MGELQRVSFTNEDTAREVCAHYIKLLSTVAQENNILIEVCVCHGNRSAMVRNPKLDKLYIYTQIAPGNIDFVSTHFDSYTLNGEVITFPIKQTSAQKCPQGDAIAIAEKSLPNIPEKDRIYDDKGTLIAFIYQFDLYIVNDFTHSRNPDELIISRKVFDYIFSKACNELQLINRFKNSYEEKAKNALTKALQSQLARTLEKERIQLKAANDTIAQYTTGIVDCERRIMVTQQVISGMEKEVGNLEHTMQKRWNDLQRLSESPFYESISFEQDSVVARTAPIICRYRDKVFYYGKYTISVSFAGATTITADNRIDNQYDHPHINKGNVCWGNFSGVIPKLIGACQFDVALNMIYQFLEHYDEANPYCKIDRWPVATKEQIAEDEQRKKEMAQGPAATESKSKKSKQSKVVAEKIASGREDAAILESAESEIIIEEAIHG